MTRRPPCHRRSARAQRGAALLVAMIVVTLVATLASAMVWQQWRATQIEMAERARTQSTWMLKGALDWARLILREDARPPKPPGQPVDHLNEPWALPLAEARLSTFLAVDRDNTDDAPEAFLSGSITDAQSRYNLTNLYDAGKVLPLEQAVLGRLCQGLGLSADLAARIAGGMRDAIAPPTGTAEGAAAPLLPRSVSQLTWFGLDAATVQRLEPFVTLLPVRTPVNLNTAPREVLAAVIPGLDLGSAERLVQTRQRTHFSSLADVQALVPGVAQLKSDQVSVTSNFFVVRGRLRLEDRVLEQTSLVERRGMDVIALQREVVSSREQTSR